VPARDLFFSTTNLKGVITSSNMVFVRLSRFGYDKLLGAPHNIIRHPKMPGGAFKLMWDTLQDGQPFCTYVDNLAADGSTYSVFATITPLGDDSYLSVRCRPQCTDLRSAVMGLFDETKQVEAEAEKIGKTPRIRAGIGAEHLVGLLEDAGFRDIEDFANQALPAEMAIRLAHPTNLARTDVDNSRANDLLTSAIGLSDALRQWLAHQELLNDFVSHLRRTVPQLRESLIEVQSAVTNTPVSSDGFDPMMIWVNLWAVMMDGIGPVLTDLEQSLDHLALSCQRAGFRISLAALHTEAVAQFASELRKGINAPGYSDNDRAAALSSLRRAIGDGIASTQQYMAINAALAATTLEQVRFAQGLIDVPRQVIGNWQASVSASSGENYDDISKVVLDQVAVTDSLMGSLDYLSQQIASIVYDTSDKGVDEACDTLLACMA